ncbi:GNAT family N-acetyltransferase [Plasticicumulans sp.]|uniref:GNAT family N-acetyltransferase n=1 Tax=Plasticicumulans sp. TaxID=2307179 RepID=UPI002C6ED75F|nr:GNAT family N-acetyltransferase [Plasticicumulans sp.]HNG50230.1 GNAT family N-acetyltransferase [Plasticicumulans sp.]HNM44682.1 GNAT family N-acetyltransferase [Plasticicumulans sp.]
MSALNFSLRPARVEEAAIVAGAIAEASGGYAPLAWSALAGDGDLHATGARCCAADDGPHSWRNALVLETQDGAVAGVLLGCAAAQVPPVAAVLGADGSDLCAPVRMQVPDTWLLVGMTIFSPWRNYGLGHRLLVQACSQARAAGFDRVSLIACEHNPATRLYRREGFTVVERRPILPHPLLAYAGDVLLMVRALS